MLRARLPGVLCVLVLCGILTAGLWPFHAPPNRVSWLGNGNGLRLGRLNAVLSAATFPGAQDETSCSIALWVTPGKNIDASTILGFYTPDNPFQFSLRQYESALILRTEVRDKRATLGVEGVFREGKPVLVEVTSGPTQAAIYVDGKLVESSPRVPRFGQACTGQLILGGSPMKRMGWRGVFRGLAIYHTEVSAAQARKRFESRTIEAQPDAVAVYRFNEGAGNVVHNEVRDGINLNIPERYELVDQVFLERPWREYRVSSTYWLDIIINIVGFIPLGWCFYDYLTRVRRIKRATLVTIATGTAASLTIELLQSVLPSRSSGMTDLFTNTLGTYLGVLLWRIGLIQRLIAMVGLGWMIEEAEAIYHEV
jgi:VanZ family protein